MRVCVPQGFFGAYRAHLSPRQTYRPGMGYHTRTVRCLGEGLSLGGGSS